MDEASELEKHFRQRSQENIVKFRNAMVEALQKQQWGEALDLANKVVLLDPSDAMVHSFQQLLQEKADRDDSEDDDEDGDDDGDGVEGADAGTGAAADGTDADDASEDEDEAESEDDEGEASSQDGEEDASSALAAAARASSSQSRASTACSKVVSGVALDRSSCTTTSKQRAALRATLQADIKQLKEQMLISTMVADDPLLNA